MARLSQIVAASGGRLVGSDAEFAGAEIDSRKLQAGQLFVALPGSRVDGHDFVDDAQRAGAVAALVAHEVEASLPQVVVDDVLAALQRYASAHRQAFEGPVIAVTGSNGKTSTKEMLAAILACGMGGSDRILATRGNLNNHIGLPLTLLGVASEHRAAVLEMGANHPGEIAMLTAMARPDIGVITMAGASHLEGFGSVEGVAHAKGELFDGLPDRGAAVINADDPYCGLWRELAGSRRQLLFGLAASADIRADNIREDGGCQWFQLCTPAGEADVRLPLSGAHNVMNALAAAAAAFATGMSADAISEGLAQAHGVGGRLQVFNGPGGARVVDDSYNANPASVRAALEWLARQPGEHWMVLGDMGELGDAALDWHRRVGEWIRQAGIRRLLTLGELSSASARAFGDEALCFDSHEACAAYLQNALAGGAGSEVTLLVKGSRSMRMERVIEALLGHDPQALNQGNAGERVPPVNVVNGG